MWAIQVRRGLFSESESGISPSSRRLEPRIFQIRRLGAWAVGSRRAAFPKCAKNFAPPSGRRPTDRPLIRVRDACSSLPLVSKANWVSAPPSPVCRCSHLARLTGAHRITASTSRLQSCLRKLQKLQLSTCQCPECTEEHCKDTVTGSHVPGVSTFKFYRAKCQWPSAPPSPVCHTGTESRCRAPPSMPDRSALRHWHTDAVMWYL